MYLPTRRLKWQAIGAVAQAKKGGVLALNQEAGEVACKPGMAKGRRGAGWSESRGAIGSVNRARGGAAVEQLRLEGGGEGEACGVAMTYA